LAAFKSSAYAVRRDRLELPAYDQLDLRAGLSYRNLDLTVFASNVTDERGITNRTDSPSAINPSTISLIRPRTIGIDASIHF
jgi:outer membrane receptor protein involved in Fe transport